MTELLQFDDGQVQPLDFTTAEPEMPETQKQYEYDMQTAAGYEITADFEGIRSSLAQKHKDEEDAELYEVAEQRLRAGEDPFKVSKDLQSYTNIFNSTDTESSLEVEAGRNNAAKALQDNPATRINAYDEPLTYNNDDFAVKDLLVERFKQSVDEYLTSGNKWSKYMGKAITAAAGVAGVSLPQLKNIYENSAESLADFAANIVPFFSQAETASVGEHEGVELSALTTGERQKAEFLRHHLTDTPEQFAKFIEGLEAELDTVSPTTVKTVMENVFGAIDTSNDIFNLIDVIDLTGSAVSIGKAFKGGLKSSTNYYKLIGDMQKANDIVVDALDKGTETVVLLEDVATHSATQPFQSQGLLSHSNAIADIIDHVISDKMVMEKIAMSRDVSKLSEKELEIAKEITTSNIRDYLHSVNNDFVDIQAVDVYRNQDGAYMTRVSIGGGLDGKIGMTKKAATKLAKDLGLLPDEYTILKKDGQGYYIDVDRAVKEDELMTIGADDADDVWKNAFSRTFQGTLNVSEKQHLKDITAFRQRLGFEKFLRSLTASEIKSLSKADRKAFRDLYKAGQKYKDGLGKWLSKEEAMGITRGNENAWKAYKAFRRASDIEYFITNAKVRAELLARGYRLLNDNDIVRPVKITEANFGRVFIKDCKTYEELQKKLKQGFQVVEVHKSQQLGRKLNYTHKLIDMSKDTLTELPRYITPYQAGGRRAYTNGTCFVKIGTTFRPGINGFARTIKAGLNKKELQAYAEEINKLIDIYKQGGDELSQTRAINDLNLKHVKNVSSADDLKTLMRSETNSDGIIDPNYRAQVLEDGETYIFGNNNPSVYDGTERLHDALDDLVRMREESFNGRGRLLDQINEKKAKMLDVVDVWDRTVRRATSTQTLADLDKWYQREFRRKFGDYIKDSRFYNDDELLRVDLSEELLTTDREVVSAAKNFQQHYQRLTGAKTGLDKTINHWMTTIAKWSADHGLIKRGKWQWDALTKGDPIAGMRTIEFYNVMAGNFSQIWKQPLDLIATGLAHPIDTTKALAIVGPALHALHFKRTGKPIYKAYKTLGERLGVDMDRLTDFLDSYASVEMVGKMDPVMYKNSRSWFYRHVGQFATAPFQAGQGVVNVLTDIIAFMDNPTAEFSKIAQHADDLTRNMTKVSESAFQYGQKLGFTKLAAQWKGYMTHSLEALFNKRLTKRERVAIAATQLALLGGVSNVSKNLAVNFYRNAMIKDDEISPEIKEGIGWGILHNLAKEFGLSFNEDIGIADQVEQVVQLLTSEVDGNTKVMDMLPSINGLGGVYATVSNINKAFRPDTDEFDTYLLAENFATNPNSPTGAKNLARAFVMWKNGMYFNSRRQPINSAGVPIGPERNKYAIAALLGLAPYDKHLDDIEYRVDEIRQDTVDDAVKEMEAIVAAAKAFESSTTEDPMKAEEERNRIFHNYRLNLNGHYETLKDTYGVETANGFADRVNYLWRTQEAGEKTHRAISKYDPMFYQYLTYGDK